MARKASAKSNRSSSQGKSSDKKPSNIREFPRRSSVEGPFVEPKPPYHTGKQRRPGLNSKMKPNPYYKAPAYKAAGKLDQKVALITGGDSGIGRSVATLYAREGANVAIVYLREEQTDAEETKRSVEEEGVRCLLIQGDVTDPDFANLAVQSTIEEFGKLDILVNNAAYQHSQENVEKLSEAQWDHTFRTNIYGYFHMVKAALPHLKPGSAIINTGSITGLEGNKDLLDYSATKGAIHAFTKSLAQNLIDRQIRVNCVAPGPIWTPLVAADYGPEDAAEHGKSVAMKRAGQPEEVAPAYVFLASEADSSYITGEILTLLGGKTTAA